MIGETQGGRKIVSVNVGDWVKLWVYIGRKFWAGRLGYSFFMVHQMVTLLLSTTLSSPCVRNCCLNDEDICLGCGRSLVEITRWSTTTEAEKQVVLSAAAERREQIQLRQKS